MEARRAIPEKRPALFGHLRTIQINVAPLTLFCGGYQLKLHVLLRAAAAVFYCRIRRGKIIVARFAGLDQQGRRSLCRFAARIGFADCRVRLAKTRDRVAHGLLRQADFIGSRRNRLAVDEHEARSHTYWHSRPDQFGDQIKFFWGKFLFHLVLRIEFFVELRKSLGADFCIGG